MVRSRVLEHLPPQQGLRPVFPDSLSAFLAVLEHLPPQQGLRPTEFTLQNSICM